MSFLTGDRCVYMNWVHEFIDNRSCRHQSRTTTDPIRMFWNLSSSNYICLKSRPHFLKGPRVTGSKAASWTGVSCSSVSHRGEQSGAICIWKLLLWTSKHAIKGALNANATGHWSAGLSRQKHSGSECNKQFTSLCEVMWKHGHATA